MTENYKIVATIRAEIDVQAVNVIDAIERAKGIADEIDGHVRDFDVCYIQQGNTTFTYDYGCHSYREQI